MAKIIKNPYAHSSIWTLSTAIFAFGGEYLASRIFKIVRYAISDSNTLNHIVETPNEIFTSIKLFHYTILILSALSVEYILFLIKSNGANKSSGQVWQIVGSIVILILVFLITFFFQMAHQFHEIQQNINKEQLTCSCHGASWTFLITSLLITFLIRLGINKSDQSIINN